jgi:hypothetical protein
MEDDTVGNVTISKKRNAYRVLVRNQARLLGTYRRS